MTTITTDHRTVDGKTPTSVLLLRTPLDFILEDHLRLRTQCAEMDRLSETTDIDACAVAALIEYLHYELPLLLADEDDDLMPLLAERALPDDELPKLAKRLENEHDAIAAHVARVESGLARLALHETMPAQLCEDLRALANASRRHLILENAVLLPLARARLTSKDLHRLRGAMLRRRGLDDLFR